MPDKRAGLWWQSRPFLWACILLSAVPLLWAAVPPLTDMGDHIGSYRILAEAGRGPLSRYYEVHWAAVGNLGVEAIVLALHGLFGIGIEPAAKFTVLAIPPLTVAGMIALARAVHGDLPASAMLALVGIHVLGVGVASLRHRENLVAAMVSGRKRSPGAADIA